MTLLRLLFTPGAKLDDEQLRLCLKWVIRVGLVLLGLVLIMAGLLAFYGGHQSASYQGADFLVRSVLAWGGWIQTLAAGWIGFEALDSSKRGKWMLHWSDGDDAYTQATKMLNNGLIFLAFLIAAALVFGKVG